MNGSDHIEQVYERVRKARLWLYPAGSVRINARYTRLRTYRGDVSLQVLFNKGRPDYLEVGLAFDSNDRSTNDQNLEEYREQMEGADKGLGIEVREGQTGIVLYLVKAIPLQSDPESAYQAAAELALKILDLNLGGRAVRDEYRILRDLAKRS